MKRDDSIHSDFGDQGGLFDGVEKKTFSRRQDPPTSKAGLNRKWMQIKGELLTVLIAVDQMITGFTARELSNHSGLDYIVIQKRLSVLQRKGFVTKSDPEDPNPEMRNGRMVWRRTQKGAVTTKVREANRGQHSPQWQGKICGRLQ